jgi:hypothetical protein
LTLNRGNCRIDEFNENLRQPVPFNFRILPTPNRYPRHIRRSWSAGHKTAAWKSNLLGGQATGYVSRWSAATGEMEMPGTRIGYPNGVVVTPDARYMYVNAWTAREVHKYNLKDGKETVVIKLDFMPDNLTWTSDRHILAAGVVGVRGDCPAGSGAPCGQGFGVAQIDPATMQFHSLFDWQGKTSPIGGVSVALKVENSIYLGAFQGDGLPVWL